MGYFGILINREGSRGCIPKNYYDGGTTRVVIEKQTI